VASRDINRVMNWIADGKLKMMIGLKVPPAQGLAPTAGSKVGKLLRKCLSKPLTPTPLPLFPLPGGEGRRGGELG